MKTIHSIVAAGLLISAANFPPAFSLQDAPESEPSVAKKSTESIDQLVEAFDRPRMEGPGIDAAGRSLTLGHLSLDFRNGRLSPIRIGNRIGGLYFYGSGHYSYTSEDRYEVPFLAENVSEGSSYRLDGSSIDDSFSSLVLYTSSSISDLLGVSEWPTGGADPTASSGFAKHRNQRVRDQFVTAETQLAQAVFEGIDDAVHYVEIGAGKEDVVWVFDPFRDGLETFVVLEELRSNLQVLRNRRYPNLLSSQPIGRDRLGPPPKRFKITNLDITLENPKGRSAEVTVRERIHTLAPVRTLAFQLENDLLGTVGARGTLEMLEYRLHSVQDSTGRPLPFSHRRNQLVIQLPSQVPANAEFVLEFQMSGDILYRPNNDNYWRLTSSWYPEPNYWEGEDFTYHAIVKVAEPFTPFSSGRTVRRWKENGLDCAEFEETRRIGTPALMAGKYKTATEESGDRIVRVSSYAEKQPRAAKKLAELTMAFIEFYEPFLGEYPFSEINVVEINSLGFGQAPAGVIFITREAFEPRSDQATRLFSEGINARLAHEVAHAWWGHVARLSTPEDQWISEAVSEYYSAVAMGAMKSKSEFKTALSHWMRGTKEVGDRGTVYLANYTTGDRAGINRSQLLYDKGAVVLHALRQEVGDDAFFTILKSFLRSFPGQPARTSDFIGLSSFVAQRDLRPWFDRYLFGTEIPPIK